MRVTNMRPLLHSGSGRGLKEQQSGWPEGLGEGAGEGGLCVITPLVGLGPASRTLGLATT